ncbi:MAG: 30S ribosome-binding factor RbfA [Firmicutes bacterium]|jgi:ribosome-binding factor A|nr:30S ribosome-binding factor RbfA [Bacillota bacterium]HPU00702.1 30S ribosome-binding factor RbfA [Bacillota bacterium]
MSLRRAQRVAEEMKKEISRMIAREIKDPGIAPMTSVTAVELSRDLRHATVYVSVFGTPAEREKTMQALARATGFVRSEIGRRIRLRHTPEIHFSEDHSLEYGAHIDKVLKSLQKENAEK